jgi:hypothetical protein
MHTMALWLDLWSLTRLWVVLCGMRIITVRIRLKMRQKNSPSIDRL